jgi:hypothetical protein
MLSLALVLFGLAAFCEIEQHASRAPISHAL